MPNFIKNKLSEEAVDWIPKIIKNFFGKTIDVYQGFKTINVEFTMYANFYVKNLLKFSLKKIGYKNYKIAKIYKDIPKPDICIVKDKHP